MVALAADSVAGSAGGGDAGGSDRELRSTLHANRCLALIKQGGRAEEALADAQAACRLRPRWAKAQVRLAQAQQACGRCADAAAAYHRAVELDPALAPSVGAALAALERQEARRRCRLVLQHGQRGVAVYDAAASPQPVALGALASRLIATAGADGAVRLFCSGTGAALQQLVGHADRVTSLAWSPCGGQLASASLDGTARLWQLMSTAGDSWRQGQAVAQPGPVLGEQGGSRVSCLAWSPDGALLSSGTSEGRVAVWSAADGACHKQLGSHGGLVTAVAFSPCGQLLASASGDGACRVWSTADWELLTDISWPSGPVNSCRFLSLTAAAPAAPLTAAAATPTAAAAAAAAARPLSTLLLTCHVQAARREGRVLLWDVVSRQNGWVDGTLQAPLATLDCFQGKVCSVASWPAASSRSVGDAGTGAHAPAAVDSDDEEGALLAAACSDGSVRLFDLAAVVAANADGPAASSKAARKAAEAPLLEVALPEGSSAAAAAVPDWGSLSLQAAAHDRNLVALSPDGRLLAAAGPDRRVLLLDAEGGEQRAALAGHCATLRALCWLDAATLLTAGEDGTARLWDLSRV